MSIGRRLGMRALTTFPASDLPGRRMLARHANGLLTVYYLAHWKRLAGAELWRVASEDDE